MPIVYPGIWEPTQASWDGKRDFQRFHGTAKQWAECKMYEKRISINIISPTLVMALIEDASVILIFSFSALNPNAHFYLGQFARATGKDVRVYDDEVLEQLILTTAAARKEFPAVTDEKLPEIKRFIASARLSKDPDIEHASDGSALTGDERDVHLSIGSTFAVDILLTNAGINTGVATGRIRVAAETFEMFRLLNREIPLDDPSVPFEVQPGASTFQRLLFRARRAGRLNPPRIFVERDGATPQELSLDPVVVSSVLAVPLVGEAAHAARERFRTTAGARDKPIFYYLHGGSGTGKSRLLRELRDELLARAFAVFSFNGADEHLASFDVFLRHLVARLAKLPLLEGIEPPQEKIVREAAERGVALLELLYDPAFQPSKHVSKCAGAVLSLLAPRKAAVFIDNLQYFDDETIAFANEIVTASAGMAAKTTWAFGINDDMTTPEMPVAAFAGRLAGLWAEARDDSIEIHVRGFSDDDRRHYLDEALTLSEEATEGTPAFTVAYPLTTKMILAAVESKRPLFLEQTLHYAADLGALKLTHGVMYVADIDLFNVALTSLAPTLRTLLAERWQRIRKTLPATAVRAVEALAILSSIPMLMTHDLEFSPDDVRLLESRGVACITDSNEARFQHEQHEQYFAGLYGMPDQLRAREMRDQIARSGYAAAYPLELVVLRHAARDVDDEAVAGMARLLLTTELAGQAQQRAAAIFLEILNAPWHSIDPALELDAVSAVCQSVKRHRAFQVAAEAYTRSREVRRPRMERYLAAGDSWFEFVRHHVNAYFAVHRDGEALPILQESIDSVQRFAFSSADAQRLAAGKILNRLGVAWKTVHDLDAAVACIRESLAIAREVDEPGLVYKNYVDWGYVYHGFGAMNDQLIARWEDALHVFDAAEAGSHPLESERPSAMLHYAAILILRHQASAIEVIEQGVRLSSRRLTPFHEVKLLLLRVIAELAWGDKRPSATLMSWIDRAQDRAATAAAYRSYWTVFYTRARLQAMLGRERQALDTFVVALQQLAKILNDPRMEERYAPFYEDLAIEFRRQRRPLDQSITQLIRNSRIRSAALSVAAMADGEFDEFLAAYRPTSTYHDGRFNLPVP